MKIRDSVLTRKGFLEKKKMPPPPPPPNPARVVILVDDTSSRPVLHFYQVSTNYCEGYSSYRVDKKSNSNTRKGYNSKSKKARVVIFVRNTPSRPVLHFYKVSAKFAEGYSSNQIQTQEMVITPKVKNPKLAFL